MRTESLRSAVEARLKRSQSDRRTQRPNPTENSHTPLVVSRNSRMNGRSTSRSVSFRWRDFQFLVSLGPHSSTSNRDGRPLRGSLPENS